MARMKNKNPSEGSLPGKKRALRNSYSFLLTRKEEPCVSYIVIHCHARGQQAHRRREKRKGEQGSYVSSFLGLFSPGFTTLPGQSHATHTIDVLWLLKLIQGYNEGSTLPGNHHKPFHLPWVEHVQHEQVEGRFLVIISSSVFHNIQAHSSHLQLSRCAYSSYIHTQPYVHLLQTRDIIWAHTNNCLKNT